MTGIGVICPWCIGSIILELALGDFHQLSLKDQGGTAGNGTNSSVSVGEIWRDGELSLLADGHSKKPLFPAMTRKESQYEYEGSTGKLSSTGTLGRLTP